MKEYHKIQTVFLRDPNTKYKTLLMGQYALPEFEYLAQNDWVWTEKVDGTNIRVIVEPGGPGGVARVRFGGKTDDAQIPAFLVTALHDMFMAQKGQLTEMFPEGACLYGEGYGAKIQKGGGNYLKTQSFVLFDVQVGPWWLQRPDVKSIADDLNIDCVPIFGMGPLPNLVNFVRGPFLSQWGDFEAEGIVARPRVELKTRSGHRIITKLKKKDFAHVKRTEEAAV